MRIVCIGGGPAGLYFGILMKMLDPSHVISVVERNRPYAGGHITEHYGRPERGRPLRAVRVGGEPILRLDTLLDAFPDASFLIDLKTVRAAAPLVDAVRRTRSAERVCVADGRDTWLRDVAETTGCARSLGWRGLLTLMGAAKTGTRAPRRVLHGAFAAHIATRLGGIPWMADARAAARLVDMTHDAGLRLVRQAQRVAHREGRSAH